MYRFWRNRQRRRRDDDNNNGGLDGKDRNQRPAIGRDGGMTASSSFSPNYVKATVTPGYKDERLYSTMSQMQTLKTSLRKIGYDPETKRKEKLQHMRQQNIVTPPPQEIITSTKKSATNGRSMTSGGYLGLSTARLQQARQSLKHKDKLRRRSVHHKYYNSASSPNDTARPVLHHTRETVRHRPEHTTMIPADSSSSSQSHNSSHATYDG